MTNRLTKVEIVGGSAQGGLTFLGLGALLTNAKVNIIFGLFDRAMFNNKVPFSTKELSYYNEPN